MRQESSEFPHRQVWCIDVLRKREDWEGIGAGESERDLPPLRGGSRPLTLGTLVSTSSRFLSWSEVLLAPLSGLNRPHPLSETFFFPFSKKRRDSQWSRGYSSLTCPQLSPVQLSAKPHEQSFHRCQGLLPQHERHLLVPGPRYSLSLLSLSSPSHHPAPCFSWQTDFWTLQPHPPHPSVLWPLPLPPAFFLTACCCFSLPWVLSVSPRALHRP